MVGHCDAPIADRGNRRRQEEYWRSLGHPARMDSPPLAEAISSGVAGVDELLTPGQAGEYLRTGERSIRRLIAERRIAYVKLGKHVRLQRSTLDAFIESGRVHQSPDVR